MKYFLLLLATIFSPLSVHAQPVNIGDQFFAYHPNSTRFHGSVGDIISVILPNVIVVAGLFFFFLIIYGGFLLIVYGGQINSPQRVQKGKNTIIYGLIGFLLVIGAYFILQIISTITGVDFTNPNIT